MAHGSWRFWYFTSLLSFALYHWILAYRYFAASREMPYIFDGQIIPSSVLTQNKILKYTGIFFMIIASFYVFIDNPYWIKASLFLTFCLFMAVASIMMVVALINIRSRFLSQG